MNLRSSFDRSALSYASTHLISTVGVKWNRIRIVMDVIANTYDLRSLFLIESGSMMERKAEGSSSRSIRQ